ncbi:response regulator transcription factor [Nocardioides guangzhouensis]|uniref:Response regulator transcription factor n=1 Tax=Nocardioides guangzhouensis TaxID=2497878 RepID=A0A4Q4ZE14_9ACTN|nr:response regulator transcription factor [Nocardioides guangzhouensis]RYP86287.1 response regulator transcription factor [Nocardioides guangzhouensis]
MAGYVSNIVKVYLLDDHDLVRRGLRDLLAAARDIQVVGDSSSARGAARAILELGTNVMVLDLQLQDGTGIEVCREVRAVDPSVSGLLLTSFDEDEALAAAILAGAGGYIVKASRSADLIGAVRRLSGGRSMIDPALAEPVIGRLRSQIPIPPLDDHEQLVLGHVLDGLTDSEVADRMGMEVGPTGAEVAALIGRITSPAPEQGHLTSRSSPGKHRRG